MFTIDNPLEHVRTRLNKMRSARTWYEQKREANQLQVAANSFEENGKFYPNTKLEQAIIEMRLWGRAWDIIIDVEPDTLEPNQDEAIIAKHVLYKFMHEEEFHKELRQWRHDKSVFGTGIFWAGISHDITCEIKNEKRTVKAQIGNGFYGKKWKTRVYKENRTFTPKNLSVYQVFLDDNAIVQPNFKKATDCIVCEYGTKDEILNRWYNVPGVDKEALDQLMNTSETDPEYGVITQEGQVTLYHYFNKLTKDWFIMWQEKNIIYSSVYEYACEWLPVVFCQHHPRNDSIYGLSDPEVIDALKAAKNASWQAIVDWTMLSSGKLILSGNSWEMTDSVSNQTKIYSGEVNFKDVTNSISEYKEIDTRVDLNPTMNLLALIDDEVRSATGIDVKAAFEAPEQNLWQTEIKEENKAIRLKAIDELEDFAIGEALTICLNNIIKFAPSLKRSTKEISFNGKITEITSPYTLQLPDVKIEWIKVEEDLWNYGELEFTDDMVKGYVKVRVVTTSTNNSKLTVLEKNKVKEMSEILERSAAIYGIDKVVEQVWFDWYWNIVSQAYWYGDKDTQAKSKKQKTKDENIKKLEALQWMAASFTDLANPNVQQQTQTGGGQPQAQTPALWGVMQWV